jgi:hypothetical protein
MGIKSLLVEATAYTPTQFGADLAAGDILLWVGAAVVAAVPVMLALIGIKRGMGAFRGAAR